MLTETHLWPEPQTLGRVPSSLRHRRAAERRARQGRRKPGGLVVLAVITGLAMGSGGAYALSLFGPVTESAEPASVVVDAEAAAVESMRLRVELAVEVKDARSVLTSPDGKAAEKPKRQALKTAIEDAQGVVTSLKLVTWPPSGTEEQATAVLERAAALHDDARAARGALRDASRALVVSGQQIRLERVMAGLEEVRVGLDDTVVAGEQVYAESAQTAEATESARLRGALDRALGLLDQAGTLSTQAGATHQADAVADLLGVAGELTTAISAAQAEVKDATAAVLAGAPEETTGVEVDGGIATGDTSDTSADAGTGPATDTPAGTCPEPDQVWSAENGHLASSELAPIPFAAAHSVRVDVVGGLADLNAAYAAEFGVNLTINSSYRSYASQESLYDPSSKTAAPPGCSNHGTGLAIDIGGGVQAFGSAQYEWLKANAESYGWVHPPFAEPSGRNPEPWHWQSVQAPNSY